VSDENEIDKIRQEEMEGAADPGVPVKKRNFGG
jgi:hypothetical protein